jgi:hypothetical protein
LLIFFYVKRDKKIKNKSNKKTIKTEITAKIGEVLQTEKGAIKSKEEGR